MTSADIIELLAKLFAVWTLGFASGFFLTRFKEAVNQAV